MSGLEALESSCAPNAGFEGSIENMYESGLPLSPPSPRSLSEAAPSYSLIGSYPPPVNSPARFPPPPNSGFPQSYHLNMTFFEGQPAPHHSLEHTTPEPRATYDHWPERSVSSVSGYGLDGSTKHASHWPLPFADYIDNSKHVTLTSEPLYPTITASTQYPLSECRSKTFGSKFPSSVQDYHSTASPSATVSSTSSVSSPHFSSSSLETARPQFSNRFSFNPHASAFYPGMYSRTSYGPSEDVSPYYEPSYISHLALTDFLSNSHQGVDSFHDASSRPVHSPETAPRPIISTAPSFFSGVHSFSGSSATFSNPVVAPQPVSSRTDYCGLTSSSDGSGVRESPCDFPPVSSLSFGMPVPRASVFTPYDATTTLPLSGQLKTPEVEEDDMAERILKESGTLLYHQHISPEEWRWNIYEAQYEAMSVEGLVDLADCTSRSYRSTYNYFQGVDRIGPNCVNEAVGGDSNSFFALSILERSKFQNQGGPSLKLAASALAEMLATSSTGQSMMAHIASFPRTTPAPPGSTDMTYPLIGDSVEALQLPRFEGKSPDDCCSSSGSAAVVKEANDASTPGGPTVYDLLSSCIPVESERGSVDCMRFDLPKLDASGQSRNSTSARPLTTALFNTVPQGGSTHGSPGLLSCIHDASGGILQKTSANSTGLNLENVSSEKPNLLFTQTLDVSPETDSGTTRRVTTQPVVSSEDDASVAGPLRASVTTIDTSTSGLCQDVSSSRVQRSACQNIDLSRGSALTGTSPPLSQTRVDPLLGSAPTVADEVATKLLASFNLLSSQTVNTVQAVPPHYSGLQSLTTSISNLTNVLLASHTSALTQSDIAPIQESLQASILGLSECLLLEQGKVNRQPVAKNCVGRSGLKDSEDQEQVHAELSSENLDLKCQVGAKNNIGQRYMTALEGGSSEEVRPRSNGASITSVNVGDNKTALEADMSQKNVVLRKGVHDIPWHFQVGGSGKAGRCESTTAFNPTNTFQLQRDEINNILDYLRQQDIANLPALKKLLAAEEREGKLKVLIQDLREQLDFEKEESRGAAFLYGKIMQEADVRNCKLQEPSISSVSRKVGVGASTPSCLTLTSPSAVLRPAQPSSSVPGTISGIADHLEREDGVSGVPECHREANWNEDTGKSVSNICEKDDCHRMEIESTEVKYPGFELEYSNLDAVEARLALLRGRRSRNMEEEVLTETESFTLDSPRPADWNSLVEGGRRGRNMEEEVLTKTESFTPDGPCPADWNRVVEGVNDCPYLGLQDGQLATNRTSSRLTSQILKQSDVLFNMDAAWTKGFDYVGSPYEGMESRELEGNEPQSHTVTEAFDNSLSVEACARIIGSSSRFAENVRVDSGDENFAGGLDSGSLHGDSGISGLSVSENNRFETMHDGSDISLGIVGSDIGNRQQAVVRNTSLRSQRENEVACLLESPNSDTEAVKNVIQLQDSEEESGWEHVRLPRQISK